MGPAEAVEKKEKERRTKNQVRCKTQESINGGGALNTALSSLVGNHQFSSYDDSQHGVTTLTPPCA